MGNSQNFKVPKDVTPQKLERGVPKDVEEFISWLNPHLFKDLPPRGQEAFFKFLRRGNVYSEDKEITEVKVNEATMTDNSRSYQFWLKCHKLDLDSLYEDYLNDSGHRLPQAPPEGGEEQMKTKEAKEVNKYISDVRKKVEHDLNTAFDSFKKDLKEKYGERGEKLKRSV